MFDPDKNTTTASRLYQRLQTLAQGDQASSGEASSQLFTEKNASSSGMPDPGPETPETLENANDLPRQSALIPGMYKPLAEELLLDWVAPSRAFRKPNRRFFTTITMIGVLIGLILFFANQVLPVAVVIAVVFLAYVLFSIPPNDVRYRLTTYGIRIEDQLYFWEELGRFWFTQQYKIDMLHIEVSRFPGFIHLLLGDIQKEDMQEILSEVLLHERPKLTPVEKAGKWLQEKVPLDLET